MAGRPLRSAKYTKNARDDTNAGDLGVWIRSSNRHSIAVHLLNAGWDLIDVQHWLGHRSIASTQVYARVSNIRLEKKFKALRASEIAAL